MEEGKKRILFAFPLQTGPDVSPGHEVLLSASPGHRGVACGYRASVRRQGHSRVDKRGHQVNTEWSLKVIFNSFSHFLLGELWS